MLESLFLKMVGGDEGKQQLKQKNKETIVFSIPVQLAEQTRPLSAVSRLMNQSYLSEDPASISLVSFSRKERWQFFSIDLKFGGLLCNSVLSFHGMFIGGITFGEIDLIVLENGNLKYFVFQFLWSIKHITPLIGCPNLGH